MTQKLYDKAVALMDASNKEDPNIDTVDGMQWPKELLYSHRMADMLARFKPDADDVIRIAIRGQHIQRWKSPRKDYSMDRQGYHQWRTNLYGFHADTVAAIMIEAGFDELSVERAKKAVGKKGIKQNSDTQTLEDTASLVFIEYYMLAFAEKHPEYDEDKWIDIVRKTWRKMSEDAHKFALSGGVTLPEPLLPIIQKALA